MTIYDLLGAVVLWFIFFIFFFFMTGIVFVVKKTIVGPLSQYLDKRIKAVIDRERPL